MVKFYFAFLSLFFSCCHCSDGESQVVSASGISTEERAELANAANGTEQPKLTRSHSSSLLLMHVHGKVKYGVHGDQFLPLSSIIHERMETGFIIMSRSQLIIPRSQSAGRLEEFASSALKCSIPDSSSTPAS